MKTDVRLCERFAAHPYQIMTRSDSGRYMAPSVMLKALKKVSILLSVALTRLRPSECTSSFVRRAASSSRMFWPQIAAYER